MRFPFLVLIAGLVASLGSAAPSADAFGTVNGFLGQRAEHERITRAALACPVGVKSTGDCFEPRSIDQLAGHGGTFGAVGAPDHPVVGEIGNPAAHCDDADFLNVPGYPQSRADANVALRACINHLRQRFAQGIDEASRLLDANGELLGDEVELRSDCRFNDIFAGRAKCAAIEGLGRALHGVQDFYAHSNWTDQAVPPFSTINPPGLSLPAPSALLDLAGTSAPVIPFELTTGFFEGILSDTCKQANTRIKHACLAKDKALIDPTTGSASDPLMPRGQFMSNQQNAVTGAIVETRRQWADFRRSLVNRYGVERGTRMILAITQDVRKVDLVFVIDTTDSMAPYISSALAVAGEITDRLSGRTGSAPRLTDFRIAVVDYKDVDSVDPPGCPPDYDAVVDLPFSRQTGDVGIALSFLLTKVSGGCDIPEDVLSGVQRAVSLPWRRGATKAIILMGDAPGHDPEPHSGLTSAAVIAAANAVDPASIYPILVGSDLSAAIFQNNLALGTGGRTFDGRGGGGVGEALLQALSAILDSEPPADNEPPQVIVDFPEPPTGQGGFFNGSQVPLAGTVTATDPSGVTDLDCTDSANGLIQGPIVGSGSATATRSLTVTGDGDHIIFCLATDSEGNTGTGAGSVAATVIQIDATRPTVSCAVDPRLLWPPNHKFRPIATTVTVEDALSGPAGFKLIATASNESDPGAIRSFDLGTADTSGDLRAARFGFGSGRKYTLTYQGADIAGNTAICAVDVAVPHDQRKH
jgi:hypothetical protein